MERKVTVQPVQNVTRVIPVSKVSELSELKQLLDSGVISEAEAEKLKQEILNRSRGHHE
jgi:hypothetical protein